MEIDERIEFEERIEKAKCNTGFTNCCGTVMYILGIERVDEFISPSKFPSEGFVKLEEPVLYSLAVFIRKCGRKDLITHRGVVHSVDPLLIVHRDTGGDYEVKTEPVDEIVRRYKISDTEYFAKI